MRRELVRLLDGKAPSHRVDYHGADRRMHGHLNRRTADALGAGGDHSAAGNRVPGSIVTVTNDEKRIPGAAADFPGGGNGGNGGVRRVECERGKRGYRSPGRIGGRGGNL